MGSNNDSTRSQKLDISDFSLLFLNTSEKYLPLTFIAEQMFIPCIHVKRGATTCSGSLHPLGVRFSNQMYKIRRK